MALASEALLEDDGASETVELQPARPIPKPVDLARVTRGGPHSRLEALRAAGAKKGSGAITMRSAAGAVKISLSHAHLYAALVRLHLAKRTAGAPDPGVSSSELAREAGVDIRQVSGIVGSLRLNRAVRSVHVFEGFGARSTRHYPTEEGALLFGIAEHLGAGVQITVGGTVDGWKRRSLTEPATLFDFAVLLRQRGAAHRQDDVHE